MIRTNVKRRMASAAVAVTVGAGLVLAPASTVGAADDPCDYRTDRVPTPMAHEISGRVSVFVSEDNRTTDVDDVTVLVRWVGEGIDLGPAPEGDPVFSGLPDGYSVVEPPNIEREETSVDEAEDADASTIEVGCPEGYEFGTDFVGDPDDVFTWITYGSLDFVIDLRLTTTFIRTHHITETRTYQIVREDEGSGDDGPGDEGPGIGEGDDEGPVDEGSGANGPDDGTSSDDGDPVVSDDPAGENAETSVAGTSMAAVAPSQAPVTGVAGRTETRIGFTG